MPLYEYTCQTCGIFDQWKPMSEATQPVNCPTCQTEAKRIYSVAGIITTPSSLSRRIEKSAEPRIVQKQTHSHTHSHNHSHHHHTPSRPWMIGH
jgi:putative FmdB family regulatory protein